jgi:hypothetical protein
MENLQLPGLIRKIETSKDDMAIFFTPGGWGYVSLEKESYARELLKGVKKTLEEHKFSVRVIDYPRARRSILGIVLSLKEIVFSFPSESKKMASTIEELTERFRNLRIVLVGYSFGGAFINSVMKRVYRNERVYAIQCGTPFFYKTLKSKNILRLDNDGLDALAKGDFKKLTFFSVRGILKLIFFLNLIRLKISDSFHFNEHEYYWHDRRIESKVTEFLKKID